MKNLSDMNALYKVQDVILLWEIFEHRASVMCEMYGCNPRRCNSATVFSGCQPPYSVVALRGTNPKL